MKHIGRPAVLIVLVTLFSASIPETLASRRAAEHDAVQGRPVLVNVPLADVYARNSKSSERTSQILLADSFMVLRERGDWVFGSIPSQKGYRGWVERRALLFAPHGARRDYREFVMIRSVKADVLVSGNRSISVYAGTRLPLSAVGEKSYEVLMPDGSKGVIPAKVAVIEDDDLPAHITPKDIMRAADFLGAGYRWGGITGNGIDCSGFVYTVFRVNGIYLKRDSYLQAEEGEHVPFGELMEGDLVFFRSRGKRIGHVGIYVGNGNFIHSSRTMNGVVVSSLSEEPFRSGLSAARRVLPSTALSSAAVSPPDQASSL